MAEQQYRTPASAVTQSSQPEASPLADPSGGYGNAHLADRIAGKADPSQDEHAGHDHGDSKSGGVAGLPTTKATALARHTKNEAKTRRIIDAGLSLKVDPEAPIDNRLLMYRNSAEWLDQGMASLVVLSPTHDSATRKDVGAGETAFFDDRAGFEQGGADYDDATKDAAGLLTNNAGIQIHDSTVGTMSGDGNTMTLVDPLAKSDGFVVETLIHETQHDADQHQKGKVWETQAPAKDPALAENAPSSTYSSYQSEFRAYWTENPEGSTSDNFGSHTDPADTVYTVKAISNVGADNTEKTADDTVVSVQTSFQNARQQAIAEHLGVGDLPDGDWYDYTEKDWKQSYAQFWYYYAVDPKFKAMVDGYEQPVGGNLINSVRIQKLTDALGAPDVEPVWDAVAELDDADRAYLGDMAQSRPFWDLAAASLDLLNFFLLSEDLGVPSPAPPVQQTVEVQPGDTLFTIADRVLYDSSRWRELYTLNRDVIGKDPNRIEIGTVLKVPAT